MRPRRLILIALLAGSCSGCVAVYAHKEVTFHVVDGYTGSPIVGAEVSVSYEPDPYVLNEPRDASAVTGPSGEARLRVANSGAHMGPTFVFSAPGYAAHVAHAKRGGRLPSGPWLGECPGGRPDCLGVALFRQPLEHVGVTARPSTAPSAPE